MICPRCQSGETYPTQQTTQLGYRVFRCRTCQNRFNERTGTAFNHLQFPVASELAARSKVGQADGGI